MKTTLLCLAWVAAGAISAGLFMAVDLDLNFFSWRGEWHTQAISCMAGLLAVCVATWFLARATDKALVCGVAAVSCLALVAVGLAAVAPEPMGTPGQWFSRRESSPDWYRYGRLAISCAPLGILAGASFGRKARRRKHG